MNIGPANLMMQLELFCPVFQCYMKSTMVFVLTCFPNAEERPKLSI